jgi:prevent-host-death family protein
MKTVDVSEAQVQFPRLLQEVQRGRGVVITRDGVPVARLIPDVATTIAAIKEARKGLRLDGLRIKDLIEEGRL